MGIETWSKQEKQIARRAFDLALHKESKALMDEFRHRAEKINWIEDVWILVDFLLERRREMNRKYIFRYSQLIPIFSRLLAEGWLQLDDLNGLHEEKIYRIKRILDLHDEPDPPHTE